MWFMKMLKVIFAKNPKNRPDRKITPVEFEKNVEYGKILRMVIQNSWEECCTRFMFVVNAFLWGTRPTFSVQLVI